MEIWDLNKAICIWKAKNPPYDELHLMRPIYDMDCKFDAVNTNAIYTSTAYGEVCIIMIRMYDTSSKSKKPLLDFKITDGPIHCFDIISNSICASN